MTAAELNSVNRVFLDSAPLIYFVEHHPVYAVKVRRIFTDIVTGEMSACASPITLTECLVVPKRTDMLELVERFRSVLLESPTIAFHDIIAEDADPAADFRTRYRLNLPDALQLAVALRTGCDAFLTNDAAFRRVTELRVILVDNLVEA